MREHKYSDIERFAEELFFKKKICESVSIPVSVIEPFMGGQQGDPRDVTRRAFGGYITRYLIEKGMTGRQFKRPLDLAMGQLCDFRYEQRIRVIVHKKGELQDYLTRHGIKTQFGENEQKKLSQTIEEIPSEGTGNVGFSPEDLGHVVLSERDIEEILATHPEIIEEELILKSRQTALHGFRFDLVFTDSIGRTMLIELKRGIVKPTALTQIGNYLNHLTDVERGRIRPMLIGYVIPNIIKSSCDIFGIEYKEISERELKEVLKGDQNLLKTIMNARKI